MVQIKKKNPMINRCRKKSIKLNPMEVPFCTRNIKHLYYLVVQPNILTPTHENNRQPKDRRDLQWLDEAYLQESYSSSTQNDEMLRMFLWQLNKTGVSTSTSSV